jgi:hypothetical protein
LAETAKISTIPCLPPTATCSPEISSKLSMTINLKWQQLELKLLPSLLEEMQKTDACATKEMMKSDEMCK